MGAGSPEILADLLLAGVGHLRAGRGEDAVQALREVVEDAAFLASPDLLDVRARAFSLYAEALLRVGRTADARGWSERARDLAAELGDADGLEEIRVLDAEIRDALGAAARDRTARERSQRLAVLTVDQILVGLASSLERADALVQKADAEILVGRPDAAEPIARRALVEAVAADGVREEVLARIAIATVVPAEAAVQLSAAWRRAERASEFNLVSAVARAAELAGVKLPSLVGPTAD